MKPHGSKGAEGPGGNGDGKSKSAKCRTPANARPVQQALGAGEPNIERPTSNAEVTTNNTHRRIVLALAVVLLIACPTYPSGAAKRPAKPPWRSRVIVVVVGYDVGSVISPLAIRPMTSG